MPLLFVCGWIFATTTVHAQNAKKVRVFPTAGISWRSTLMDITDFRLNRLFHGVGRADLTVPYDSERNVQGFSFTPGVTVTGWNFGLEYVPALRYDVTHQAAGERIKSFLTDHHVNFFRMARKIQYGVGISVVNFGHQFSFENQPGVPRSLDIEFATYNALVILPLSHGLAIEFKAHVIPKGFPIQPEGQYLSFSTRVFYRFLQNKPVRS
jgi:hypothetical protein